MKGSDRTRRLRLVVGLVTALVVLRIAAVALFRKRNPVALARVRRFNRRCLNPVMLHVAGKRHWYAARLEHVGRRSGKHYSTPVVAQPVAGGFAVPLPYGTEVDWLRNVQAAGGGELLVGGVRYRVGSPRVVPTTQVAADLPPLYRLAARVYAFPGWLVVDAVAAGEEPPTAESGVAEPARPPAGLPAR